MEKRYQKLISDGSRFTTYRCTSRNFLFSRDHRRRSFQGWTKDCRRNQAKFEQAQKTKRGQKSMISHRGNYFLCKIQVENIQWKGQTFNGRQITSSYCGLPKQDLIIYWYDDQCGQGPCLALAPKPSDKCCRLSYCQAVFRDFVRQWSAESRKAWNQIPWLEHLWNKYKIQ